MEAMELSLLAVATRTSKIIKNVIEREENLLQNGILHVVFSQSSEIKLRNENLRRALHFNDQCWPIEIYSF